MIPGPRRRRFRHARLVGVGRNSSTAIETASCLSARLLACLVVEIRATVVLLFGLSRALARCASRGRRIRTSATTDVGSIELRKNEEVKVTLLQCKMGGVYL